MPCIRPCSFSLCICVILFLLLFLNRLVSLLRCLCVAVSHCLCSSSLLSYSRGGGTFSARRPHHRSRPSRPREGASRISIRLFMINDYQLSIIDSFSPTLPTCYWHVHTLARTLQACANKYAHAHIHKHIKHTHARLKKCTSLNVILFPEWACFSIFLPECLDSGSLFFLYMY